MTFFNKTTEGKMKTNIKKESIRTHEGAKAKHINPEMQLRRSVMSCMLWESEFYEGGDTIAKRISDLVPQVRAESVSAIAIEAREKMKLRHVPLLLVREMARYASHKGAVRETLSRVIQRADELSEFVALYWKQKKEPLAKQIKLGLADAFQKFSEYDLAKYNRDGAIKLRDVLFLCHAKAKDGEQDILWKKLIDGKLATPDTWEVALSSGADKKESWIRLLAEKKLGALALLRNLRNMIEVSVPMAEIRNALKEIKVERVLPFRFISAARYAPKLEPELEQAMFKCLEGKEKIAGTTILMVDVSGSMDSAISSKSDLNRIDAACGLAILLRELCEHCVIVTFSDRVVEVPARRGFALRDAILGSQAHSGTALGAAVKAMGTQESDRIIVISDEQSRDPVPDLKRKAYMINVASAKNGVGYGAWIHCDGFSEAIVDYIVEFEKSDDFRTAS
jgi:60 kDa SS-A/Ro ribonucleoprotein